MIRDVRYRFSIVTFQHVYRQLNEKIYKLSKEYLSLHEGLLIVVEM